MTQRKVLALVVCAAPPVLRIGELIDLLLKDGWTVCVTATPTAARWVDRRELTRQTGHPVRAEWRMPGDPEPHPPPDVVAVLPATFNVMNKWALGINDTPALGILNEVLAADITVYAYPNVKAELAAHPAYAAHLGTLTAAGVKVHPLRADMTWEEIANEIASPTATNVSAER
ncbi:flavoprotein [Micromonospora sp. NPDC050495]|uniref:flavoprotein n=1 Tax=Micromonospora sp. NPDC050495 TaxID=3154936 RepID=UPI0033FC5C39